MHCSGKAKQEQCRQWNGRLPVAAQRQDDFEFVCYILHDLPFLVEFLVSLFKITNEPTTARGGVNPLLPDIVLLSLLRMPLRPGLQWTGPTLLPAFPSQEGKPNTGSFA